MRILMVHNYYQHRGGEDECTEHDIRLLRERGHDVQLYSRHNDEIKEYSLARRSTLLFRPTWSWRSYRDIRQVIHEFQPEVVHVQNFFPLISPSAFYACQSMNVPVAYTLHDYRLLCPIGWFFRDGVVCEECLTRSIWQGVRYGCYHNSRIQTVPISVMLQLHRILGTWAKKVDAYIALTEASRQKFVEGGLPASKIFVRPNFLASDPGVGEAEREYAIFIGRLSLEKGLTILLEAWKKLPGVPLKILGDGPLRPWMEDCIRQHAISQVELVGFVSQEVVLNYIKKAQFLVMPSLWYEAFPRVILEAYATGTPVLSSRLGAMAELVGEGKTGLLFTPGNSDNLASKVQFALSRPDELARWGREARQVFEQRFSADIAHDRLIEIYAQVV